MTALKLAKLPDRTPVKITITVSPVLNRMLLAYQEAYASQYPTNGESPPTVADLIPYVIQSFLESDRSFAKAFKAQARESRNDSDRRRGRRRTGGTPPQSPPN